MQTELKRRYIYAVTKELPESQRAEIEKELQGLIEDMLEQKTEGREAAPQDLEAVLYELGSPRKLADKYREHKRYLIGPDFFPTYISILKIVLLAVSIAMLVLFIIQTIGNPDAILSNLGEALSNLFSAMTQGFLWVTLGFWLAENYGARAKDIDLTQDKDWKISDLPQLQDESHKISRADPIAGIIFTALAAVLVTSAIHLMGVWYFPEGQPSLVIPFFNVSVFLSYLPLILGSLLLRIVLETFKLASGKWTLKLVAAEFLRNAVKLAVSLTVFVNPTVWNPEFIAQVTQAFALQAGSEELHLITVIWTTVTENMIYFIGLVFILETITILVRLAGLWRSSGASVQR